MSKYKVCVYAICKNEEKFVERWVNSMKEADDIYVMDTGSDDNTVDKLRELGVKVEVKKVEPWRFDVARNLSLEMVDDDTDICVCTDLDEVFMKGWREELEKVWTKDSNRCRYIYNWRLDDDDKPMVSFWYEKIHSRFGYKWIHPVHEILEYSGEEKYVASDKIVLNHYPDCTKSRESYLSLLELSVKEESNNDRNVHYLGREYMYYGRWNDCIDTLIRHLSLESATWKDERSASMRFIARSYFNLGRYEEARMWLDKAIKEAPYLRDPYVERALLEYHLSNYEGVIYYCNEALKIKDHELTYINEVFSWDYTIYDLLSLGYYYVGNLTMALENVEIAIKMKPGDERLYNNKKIIQEAINRI
jgi:glycosyltransferase involved in cell wall biosynthesis